MNCKYCKSGIPEDSVFCCKCGERVARKKRTTVKKEVSVPKARQLPSGSWTIYLAKEHTTITEPSELQCVEKARAIRAGFVEAAQQKAGKLSTLIEAYIEKRSNPAQKKPLSPSTRRGYETIRRNNFAAYMEQDAAKIDYQKMIDDEVSDGKSGKTIKNAWSLVRSSLRNAGVSFKEPERPPVETEEQPWLDYEQLEVFLAALREANPLTEFAALFMLHSLRKSELLALTPDHVTWDKKAKCHVININDGAVLDQDNKLVYKGSPKTKGSCRSIKIMIPRLEELVSAYTGDPKTPYFISLGKGNGLDKRINRVCRKNDLPEIATHGCRRSFASLCHHLGVPELEACSIGGWDDVNTMHKHYMKLAAKDRTKAEKKIIKFYTKVSAS